MFAWKYFRMKPNVKPFCHIWFNGLRTPLVSQVTEVTWGYAEMNMYPVKNKELFRSLLFLIYLSSGLFESNYHPCKQSWTDPQRFLQSFLLSCPLPESHSNQVPSSVSLVRRECQNNGKSSTNSLRVIYNRGLSFLFILDDKIIDVSYIGNGPKKKFAVCSKGLNHLGDYSYRFIEWIEVIRSLGVHKIFLYVLQVHPNVQKVLLILNILNNVIFI